MPQIPGVPTLESVRQPMISPSEAGQAGETTARLGEQFSQLATGLGEHIRKAQEHVDNLAAQNQFYAAYLGMQDDLAKTMNSRDVEGVLKTWNDNVAHITEDWSGSPAAQDIELNAQSLLPRMQHLAQVKQVDLMGKEKDVSINNLAKGLLNEVTNFDNAKAAQDKYGSEIDSLVKSKLMPDWQAEKAKELFRKSTQITLLDRAVASPMPAVNEAGLDDLIQHPEHYPDLAPQEKDQYEKQLETAFRVNTNWMRQVGVQQFLDNDLPNFRKMFSNPNGLLDLKGAFKEIDRRESLPESDPEHINTLQGDAMRTHLNAEEGDRLKQSTENADNKIREWSKAVANGHFSQALGIIRANADIIDAPPKYQGKAADLFEKTKNASRRVDADISPTTDLAEFNRLKNEALSGVKSDLELQSEIVSSRRLKSSSGHQLINFIETVRERDIKEGIKYSNNYLRSMLAPTQGALFQALLQGATVDPSTLAKLSPTEKMEFDRLSSAEEALSVWANQQNQLSKTGKRGPLTHQEIYEEAKEIAKGHMPTMDEKLDAIHQQWGQSKPIVQRSKSDPNKYRYSTDGGRTWQPGQPPKQ